MSVHYKQPVLLIEFEEHKSFSLEVCVSTIRNALRSWHLFRHLLRSSHTWRPAPNVLRKKQLVPQRPSDNPRLFSTSSFSSASLFRGSVSFGHLRHLQQPKYSMISSSTTLSLILRKQSLSEQTKILTRVLVSTLPPRSCSEVYLESQPRMLSMWWAECGVYGNFVKWTGRVCRKY